MRSRTMFTSVGSVRRCAVAAAILAVGIFVLAGCWYSQRMAQSSSGAATTSPSVPSKPATEASATMTAPPSTDKIPPVGPTYLETEEADGLGTIVVDGSGRTVYFFAKDTPNQSTCYDACADTWLPLLTSSDPAGGIGIDVASAGTITRRDGSRQATYKGHPLYHYAGDSAPGRTNGHDLDLFGAKWYALTPAGNKVD